MEISATVGAYYKNASYEHHRYRSWEHCYGYFRRVRAREITLDRDRAAIELGFYLASWGMYRGSGFLLQFAYTVHRPVIDLIFEPRFDELWNTDFGLNLADGQLIPIVRDLIKGISTAYLPFASANDSEPPTDTLITKVILGTLGTLPACDRYFIDGFKTEGNQYSRVNDKFIGRLLDFCLRRGDELHQERAKIMAKSGISYPIMKLVDMHFWQIGYENAN